MQLDAVHGRRLSHTARYYDPGLGRFLSADTLIPGTAALALTGGSGGSGPGNPQDLNRYSYGLNNPLKNTDPSGHCIPYVQTGCVPYWETNLGPNWQDGAAALHTGLDLAGLIPGAGAVADGINAAVYAAQGDVANAALSAAAALPGPGDAATATKLTAKYGDEVAGAIKHADESLPKIIYREGDPNPGNLTPREVDNGNLSFRDSLTNPVPLAPDQRPVFRPGKPYFGVDTSKLPAGSVIPDNVPPGHVSVRGVPPDTLKQAVVERGKFPQ